jgi:hypothetical protein
MSRAEEVRRVQQGGDPEPPRITFIMNIVRRLAEHAEHPWQQVGPCVYCDACNVRLYQGEVMTDIEKAELRDVVREAPTDVPDD